MNATTPRARSGAGHVPGAAAAPLVVFTSIDGALRDRGTRSCGGAAPALAMLAARRVPVVLVHDGIVGDVTALHRELDIHAPFVCENGATMCVPRDYFPELWGLGERLGHFDVLRFTAPHDSAEAVRLLLSLFRACSTAPVTSIGVGCRASDLAWLREVDVPIIVSGESADQRRLEHALPRAYVTVAPGGAGWNEAILGSGTIG